MPVPETGEADGTGAEAWDAAAEGSALARERALRSNIPRREEAPASALPAKVLRKVRRSCLALAMSRSSNPFNVSEPAGPVNENVAKISFSPLSMKA